MALATTSPGNDSLYGGAGSDLLQVELGELLPAPSPDPAHQRTRQYAEGGPDDDVLAGSPNSDDWLHGGPGDDQLSSLSGFDVLDGGLGDDVLLGGLGRDVLLARQGDDLLFGDGGGDALMGGWGRDLLDGGPAIDLNNGGPNPDRCTSPGPRSNYSEHCERHATSPRHLKGDGGDAGGSSIPRTVRVTDAVRRLDPNGVRPGR